MTTLIVCLIGLFLFLGLLTVIEILTGTDNGLYKDIKFWRTKKRQKRMVLKGETCDKCFYESFNLSCDQTCNYSGDALTCRDGKTFYFGCKECVYVWGTNRCKFKEKKEGSNDTRNE